MTKITTLHFVAGALALLPLMVAPNALAQQPPAGKQVHASLESRGISNPELDLTQLRDQQLYECVLGSYGRYAREARYPVVNLSVPNRNLWSEAIESRLDGRLEFYKLNEKNRATDS